MNRTRLYRLAGVAAGAAMLAAVCAVAQEQQDKTVSGSVVSVSAEQITVKADDTGQVIVANSNSKQIEGTWVRDPAQVTVLSELKPGDKVQLVYFLGHHENILIRSISKVGGAVEAAGDLKELQKQVAAMQDKLNAMDKKLDTIEALVRQLAAK